VVGEAALVRVAALSVRTSLELSNGASWDADELATQAMRVAADRTLIAQSSERERAADALCRYLLRMGTRATPFGLSAGTAVVELGETTGLAVGPRPEYRAVTRPDVGILEQLVKTGAQRASLELVPVRLNPTTREHGAYYRYMKQGLARPEMVQVPMTEVLETIAGYCHDTSRTCGDIMRMLTGEPPPAQDSPDSPEYDELKQFIWRLAEETFLVGDLGVLSPGTEPSAVAAAVLAALGQQELAGAVRELAALERPAGIDAGFGRRLDDAWHSVEKLEPELATTEPRERYNVELLMPVTGTVARDLAENIARAAVLLHSAEDSSKDLLPFMGAFERRYGDAAVPVLEAADLELGLMRHLQKGGDGDGDGAYQVAWAEQERPGTGDLQVAALSHWLANGTPFDLAQASEQPEPPGVPLSVLAGLTGGDDGPRAVLLGGITGCPGALTGRFALGRERLQQVISGAVRASYTQGAHGDPDAITAELVYTPGGPVGNVLIRPGLTEQALILRGGSGSGLPLDRLVMRLENEKLAVYDGPSGRRVIVQLSSAHNTSLAMNDPLYRLLARLADRQGCQWNWGQLRKMSHLPRVVFGDVVVARERWRLSRQQIEHILDAPAPEQALKAALPGLGARRWLGCGLMSSPLAMDCDDGTAVRRALGWAYGRGKKKKDYAAVWEMPEIESPAAHGPEGAHVAEVCLTVSGTPREWPDRRPLSPALPGSSWLYGKYYSGQGSGNEVIRYLSRLAAAAIRDGLAAKWFYVRYEDDDGPHIRIRLESTGRAAKAELYSMLDQAGRDMADLGLVSAYVPADYVPEARRYGGPDGLRLAEELFYRDSEDVAARLGGLGDDEVLAAGAVDVLLWWQTAAGDLTEAVACMRRYRAVAAPALGWDARDVGKLYREELGHVDEQLGRGGSTPAVHDVLARLAQTVTSQWGRHWGEQVVGSVIHMHCNRLLGDGTGQSEGAAYEFGIRKALQLRALSELSGQTERSGQVEQ
jgi:thiopeptide-type bacteriocin biosynthesis protein